MIEPRKSVREIRAYVPPLEGRRGRVRLDFNENTSGSGWNTDGVPAEEVAAYPEYGPFMEELAASIGLPRENLMVTNGTGEAIHLIAFTFIEPCVDAALTSSPTFALIPHNLKLVGAGLIEVPATEDFRFDLKAIQGALRRGVKLVILASPDNPTGATVTPSQVRDWCEGCPETLFVIDEAYAEYGGDSALPLAAELPNLLVMRTFSKAWGMAGLRLGLVAGSPRLIEFLMRVRAPYSVNVAAMRAAAALLKGRAKVEEEARKLLARRPSLMASLEERGFVTRAAGGNFFLVMCGLDAAPLCAFLREEGVLVRDQSARPGMRGIVRVTVGTGEENGKLLRSVELFRERRALIFDLDDTLVDTSRSYDAAIARLVEVHSGAALGEGELSRLRQEGGFNDDWEAARELLLRCGVDVPLEALAAEGKKIYLPIARDNEKLVADKELLGRLSRRARLFIFTGRTRAEYEPVWSSELSPLFEGVFCKDDFDGLPAKPAPDMLRELMRRERIEAGSYVGNSVDDMRAARAAGLRAIGVKTTCPEGLLVEAGANVVLETVDDMRGAFLL